MHGVAGEVVARVRGQVRGHEARMISQARPRHPRPGPRDRQHPLDVVALDHLAGRRVQHHGVDAVHRQGARPGLHRRHAREVRDDVAARLGLPVGVHDGAPAAADVLVVPPPCLGIDGLADGAQHLEAAEIVPGGDFVAVAHEGTDRRRRGVENVDLVPLDHVPVSASICEGK